VYEAAGIGPDDIDVIQLQDTDAGAEVIRLAENGFGATGKQEKLIADPRPRRRPDGSNTDGRLIADGEAFGASGLRYVYEIVRQLLADFEDRAG
jgi:acetyl-CoA C-acetyltransferase